MGIQFRCPEIHGLNANFPVAARNMILMSHSDTHTPVWVGAWTLASANGQITVVSGENSADYYVAGLFDARGVRLPKQYVSKAELEAADYYFLGYPIGNIVFAITEDGLTTPITDGNSGSGVATYADIVVTSPTALEIGAVDQPYGNPLGTITVDSNTVNTTAGTLTLQLLGLYPGVDNNPYSATASASPRTFLAKLRSAGVSQ